MCNDLRLLQAELCELRRLANVIEQVLDSDEEGDDESNDVAVCVPSEHDEQLHVCQDHEPPHQNPVEFETSCDQTAMPTNGQPYNRAKRIVASVAIAGGAAVLAGGLTVVSGGTVWLGAATASVAGGVAASGVRAYTRSHSNDSSSVTSTSTASSMSSNR